MIAAPSRHRNGVLARSRPRERATSGAAGWSTWRRTHANHCRRFGPRRIESAPGLGLATEFAKNFFRWVRARGNRPATLSRHSCEHFTRTRMARRGSTMVLRNACATRLSCTRCNAMRSFDHGRDGCSTPRAGHGVRRQRLSTTPRDCPPFVKWSRCFLRCAVVIGVQCSSIRECTVPQLAISHG